MTLRPHRDSKIQLKDRRPKCLECGDRFEATLDRGPYGPGKAEFCQGCQQAIQAREQAMRANPLTRYQARPQGAPNGRRARGGSGPRIHKIVDKRGRQL